MRRKIAFRSLGRKGNYQRRKGKYKRCREVGTAARGSMNAEVEEVGSGNKDNCIKCT